EAFGEALRRREVQHRIVERQPTDAQLGSEKDGVEHACHGDKHDPAELSTAARLGHLGRPRAHVASLCQGLGDRARTCAAPRGARAGEPAMSPAAHRLILARGLRGFADGVVSVLLASYLTRLGFTAVEVGAIVTATLVGSAALTICVGLAGHRLSRRGVLLAACGLMLATGVGFAGLGE